MSRRSPGMNGLTHFSPGWPCGLPMLIILTSYKWVHTKLDMPQGNCCCCCKLIEISVTQICPLKNVSHVKLLGMGYLTWNEKTSISNTGLVYGWDLKNKCFHSKVSYPCTWLPVQTLLEACKKVANDLGSAVVFPPTCEASEYVTGFDFPRGICP